MMTEDEEHGEFCKAAGKVMARRIFELRGNHSEVHLYEEELATWMAAAYSLGKKQLVPKQDEEVGR